MTSIDAVLGLERREPWFAHPDRVPALLVAGLTVLALAWGDAMGVSFVRPVQLAAAPVALFLYAAYRRFDPASSAGEVALYVGLWLPFSAFSTELSFLITRMDLPLRDAWMMAADKAMGFDWIGWAQFIIAHPWLHKLTDWAYASCFFQPPLLVVLFALKGARSRNGEFLTSIALGLILTLTVYALVPTIGPAAMHGAFAGQTGLIRHLRAGFAGPYPYAGIISFPSFHTVMAILFTLAHRDSRPRLLLFGTLNLVMLGGVPFQGDHYLSDMLAGAVIAAASFLAARYIYRSPT